ncbi:hypothetical protein BDK92_7341 [Micromonospora pisi]|uniref:Uncharacterized protein n=1 Tax=Micromonospora pisi TaxID=589240 RepID=A0A495JXD7_9ACTN|nr:hypothetical protein [Micromonospora pisi]RKR92859.1 hypothetical protein BDK92_7341 [Micromonospora pisi]
MTGRVVLVVVLATLPVLVFTAGVAFVFGRLSVVRADAMTVAAAVKAATAPLELQLRRAERQLANVHEAQHRHDAAHPLFCNDPYRARVDIPRARTSPEGNPRVSELA